jgi:hypothetical protein
LGAYISDHRHRRLLRGCGERPRGGGAAGGKSAHFIDLHHEVILSDVYQFAHPGHGINSAARFEIGDRKRH